MNPQDQGQMPSVQVHNPLSVMQTGEQNIFEMKRHPIGIIGTFIGAGILLIVLVVVCFIVLPLAVSNRTQAYEIGALIFIIGALLTLGFVFVADKVYWGNRWILTSDSLTQVLQRGLFDKQSSQLSLGNLEDVTAQQDGIFPHMFNYGVLRVETAGERSKFVFMYCPNPNYYAQEILRARENFEQQRRSDTNDDPQRLYRTQGAYPYPAQPQSEPQPPAPLPPAPAAAPGPVPEAPYAPYTPPPMPPTPNPTNNPLPPVAPLYPEDPGVNVNTEQH